MKEGSTDKENSAVCLRKRNDGDTFDKRNLEAFMRLLREKMNRVILSVMMSVLVCGFFTNVCEQKGTLAWWGFLYPEFCMVEAKMAEESGQEETRTENESGGFYTKDGVKISFWLAKVFDW